MSTAMGIGQPGLNLQTAGWLIQHQGATYPPRSSVM